MEPPVTWCWMWMCGCLSKRGGRPVAVESAHGVCLAWNVPELVGTWENERFFSISNFQANFRIDRCGISCEFYSRRILPMMNKSTLVQATSHCPAQCRPRSMSSHGVTRPQLAHGVLLCFGAVCYQFLGWQPVYTSRCAAEIASAKCIFQLNVEKTLQKTV